MAKKHDEDTVVQMDPNSAEFKARIARNKKLLEERDGAADMKLYEGGYRNRGG